MPDIGAQIVRGHLQDASLAYRNHGYIADEVSPTILLPTNKSKITIYNRGDTFRDEAILRARGTETPSIDWKLSTVNLDTKQYAVKHVITKEDLRDAGINGVETPPVDLQQDAVERNSDKLDLHKEIIVASGILGGTWLDGGAGGSDADAKWVATSGNTAIADVDTAARAMENAGIPRGSLRLMVDSTTWHGMIRTSDFTGMLSYSNVARKAPGLMVTQDMVAELLGLNKVVVGYGLYSSAEETAAGTDFTSVSIWGSAKGFAFIYYYPERMGLKTMCASATALTKMENGASRATYKWYDNDRHCWIFESQEEYGYQQICSSAGYLWKDTHTT